MKLICRKTYIRRWPLDVPPYYFKFKPNELVDIKEYRRQKLHEINGKILLESSY